MPKETPPPKPEHKPEKRNNPEVKPHFKQDFQAVRKIEQENHMRANSNAFPASPKKS